MLDRLLQRIDVHIVVDVQRGSQEGIDLLKLVERPCGTSFGGCLLRLDVSPSCLCRCQRLVSGRCALCRRNGALVLTLSTLRLANCAIVSLNCCGILPPLALLSQPLLMLQLGKESAPSPHACG